MHKSKVYLVGAGPGDPHLITMKGLNLIKQADCIIYDGLVNPVLLDFAKPDAELISAAKRCGCHLLNQTEINALIVQKASQHKIVLRLKGGDPCFFGRAAEEISACVDAHIDFEIVPGVTAGIAAAEYSGLFLTSRDYASAVCFVTGRQAEGKDPDMDWQALAKFNGTLVIYMGMEQIAAITNKLIESGSSPQTPAAVIHRATLPQQRVVSSNLSGIAQKCANEKIEAPSIIVIGQAAAAANQADWFMKSPLFGKRVLITRDAQGNKVFAEKLALYGAEAVIFDSIEIVDETQTVSAQHVLQKLSDYDWVIFTSSNGVSFTIDRLWKTGLDARAFAGAKIACIGVPTAEKLAEYGLRADFVPKTFTSVQMIAEMKAAFDLREKKMLLLRSRIAPKDIVRELTEAGAQVTDTAVYDVAAKTQEPEFVSQIQEQIESGKIDYIVFTSASTACAFVNSLPQGTLANRQAQIVSIGPAATRMLVSMGLAPDIEAKVHSIDGIINAIKDTSEN